MPSVNRAHTSSSTFGSPGSAGSPSGITELRVAWPVSSENAFTSKTKPSGVRSAHSRQVRPGGYQPLPTGVRSVHEHVPTGISSMGPRLPPRGLWKRTGPVYSRNDY